MYDSEELEFLLVWVSYSESVDLSFTFLLNVSLLIRFWFLMFSDSELDISFPESSLKISLNLFSKIFLWLNMSMFDSDSDDSSFEIILNGFIFLVIFF